MSNICELITQETIIIRNNQLSIINSEVVVRDRVSLRAYIESSLQYDSGVVIMLGWQETQLSMICHFQHVKKPHICSNFIG